MCIMMSAKSFRHRDAGAAYRRIVEDEAGRGVDGDGARLGGRIRLLTCVELESLEFGHAGRSTVR